MTADKDFKRLVRARARKTGESYATARRRLSSREDTTSMKFDPAVPILRIFDVDEAKAFYVEYLGMTIDFEHRFEPGLPLYMQVSRGALVLHLSEHHGDGTPGSTVYIPTDGVRDLHAELSAKEYPNLRPGLETDEIGTWIKLIDPFGNTLRFNERSPNR
jgi:catechol 2,3-dioxygenase-like lactoylglutathione lyase family enzyme